MIESNQTKHRFGILVEKSYNIAYQTNFQNSSGNTNYYSGKPRSIGVQTEVIPDAMLTRLNELEKDFLDSSEESETEEELEGLTENDNNEDNSEDDHEESEDDDSRSKSSKTSKSSKSSKGGESNILTRATSSITNFFSLR